MSDRQDAPSPLSRLLPARLFAIASRASAPLVILATSLAAGCLALMSILHAHDLFLVDYVGGAWAGLAWWVREGILYPPLVGDGFYGGTRYGPIPIALQGALYMLTDDPIMAGKLLSATEFGLLALALYLMLRRFAVPRLTAAFMTSLLAVSSIGWYGAASVRHDAMAPALQLFALLLVLRPEGPSRRRAIASAVLCAAAVFIKVNAVWAAVGISFWLLLDNRPLGLLHIACGLVAGCVFLWFFHALSDGRYPGVVISLLFETPNAVVTGPDAGSNLPVRLTLGLSRALYMLLWRDPITYALLPLAIIATLRLWKDDRTRLLSLATILSLLVAAPIMADPGGSENHLIDILALAILLSGICLFGEAAPIGNRAARPIYRAALALFSIGLLLQMQIPQNTAADLGDAITAGTDPDYDPARLLAAIPDTGPVLSVTSLIPVLREERPIVLDTFMLRRLWEQDPAQVAPLIDQIRAHRYAAIVTLYDLQGPEKTQLYATWNWGPGVIDAIEGGYEKTGQIGPYLIRTPKGD